LLACSSTAVFAYSLTSLLVCAQLSQLSTAAGDAASLLLPPLGAQLHADVCAALRQRWLLPAVPSDPSALGAFAAVAAATRAFDDRLFELGTHSVLILAEYTSSCC
jgi:hypothetical protein